MLSVLSALFALLFLTAADDPPVVVATVPSDPIFVVQKLDGSTVSGQIRQIGPKDELVITKTQGTPETIPVRKVLKLTREGEMLNYTPSRSILLFPRGDRLFRCDGLVTTDMSLQFRQPSLGALSIPLDSVLGVVFSVPSDADALDRMLDRVRAEPRKSEVLWLSNGDRLTGNLVGLDSMKIKFQNEDGTVSLDRAGIQALEFDPALVNEARTESLMLELIALDGSRLGLSGARVEQGNLVGVSRFGATLRIPVSELASIHVRSPDVAFLSEREPAKAQYVPYVGPTRPYRRDATVDGHPFRLGGQFYDRGLGTQSRTFLAYRLDPNDRRFQALVGLDDSAGPLGSVVFRVLVDGKERFTSPAMSARDTPRPIDLDVSGAGVLILITDFGERGGVRDVADWVEARLVR